jgi:cold shock CspA family protein
MNVPLQITFRNMESSPIVKEWIRSDVEKLEVFCGRVMGCRVLVESPHRHRARGAPYHVRIEITVPGGELVVKREPSLKGLARQEGKVAVPKHLNVGVPHKDLRLAIDDAFRAAGRRLQDYVRRQSGQVKAHAPLSLARVSKLRSDDGYGFLETEDGREIYFHRESVLKRAFDHLRLGTKVTFVEEPGEKGPQASTVRILGHRRSRREAHPVAEAS